ncbi:MAG TPA: phasin family protein [Nevskia sp.]|nr:phasin family protein [Nevskia sp.]
MATKFGQLKGELDKLRRDSLSVALNANKIVYSGVQKLADRELKALNDYYRSALDAIRSADRKQGLRSMATQQLDLLQDTVNQVIAHARESMSIVAETRAELSRLVDRGVKGGSVGKAQIERAAAPARKAVGKAKAAAKKAAGRSLKRARAVTRKAVTRKAAASGRRSAVAARKVTVKAARTNRGYPESRASRATSRAQHAARGALNSFSTLSANVSSALSSFTDAVRPKI